MESKCKTMPASSHLHKGNRYVLEQHCSQEDTGSRIRKREWVQTIKSHRIDFVGEIAFRAKYWVLQSALDRKKLLIFLLSHFADHTRSKGQCSGTGLQDTRSGDKPQLVIFKSKFSDLVTFASMILF